MNGIRTALDQVAEAFMGGSRIYEQLAEQAMSARTVVE